MAAKIPAAVTLADPSKVTFQARSPVTAIFLGVVNLSAVPELVIPVLVTEVILPLASTANTGTVVADP